ncbi:MAG: cobalamin-dependent protein [Candidatus Micrarchaeota archaeon]
MRVVLVKPPLYTCSTFAPIRSAQPLGIWQLGSYLQAKGYEIRIIDSVIEGWENKTYLESGAPFDFRSFLEEKVRFLKGNSPEEFLKKYPVTDQNGSIKRTLVRTGLSADKIVERIRDFNPGWIGISIIATCEHRGAIDLAKRLRREFPEAKIVAGGQHATAMAKTVLKDSEGSIDFVVKGKGELAFEVLLEGRKPDKGLAYMQNGEFVEQEASGPVPLEGIPLLDPGLLSHVHYPLPATHSFGTNGRKYSDWMASFGCHRRCPFCCNQQPYRHFSLAHVEAQLKLFKEYGYEELILQDDSLLGGPRNDGKDFFLEVVKLFKKYGMFWHDNGGVEFERLDERVVDSVIRENEKSGPGNCTALYVPFNPRYVEDLRAVETQAGERPKTLELLRRLKNSGIYTFSSGIWGRAGQSVEDMRADIHSCEELLSGGFIDQAIIFGLSYLPETKYWEMFRHLIVDPTDWEGFSIFVPHASTGQATFDEVNRTVLEAYRRLNVLQPHVEPWAYAFPPSAIRGGY